jgi:hypothetical protein
VVGLKPEFLQSWNGSIHLYCTRQWTPEFRWFEEVRDSLLLSRLRPLSLLSLSVKGHNLLPLVQALVGTGSVIAQLQITFFGTGKNILDAATPLAALGCTLTMDITIEENLGQVSAWLQNLLASSIRINSLSFRFNFGPLSASAIPIAHNFHCRLRFHAYFFSHPASPNSHGNLKNLNLMQLPLHLQEQ